MATCRFAYTSKGKLNRKHQCRASCTWTGDECLAWLRSTPYPTHTEPARQRVLGVCACGKSDAAHWVSATDYRGHLTGLRFVPCVYRAVPHNAPAAAAVAA